MPTSSCPEAKSLSLSVSTEAWEKVVSFPPDPSLVNAAPPLRRTGAVVPSLGKPPSPPRGRSARSQSRSCLLCRTTAAELSFPA